VGVVFSIFVTFRAADRVFLKRVNNALANPEYNLILSNLFWPISIQLMTIAMLMGYIVLQRKQGNTQYSWRFFLPGNEAASTNGAVPMYMLALFSLGDQMNAAMQAPSSAFISQPMQSVMTNTVILWMLLLAFLWLRTRFKQVHLIGCVLIILSVFVGLADKLQSNDCSPDGLQENKCLMSYKSAEGEYKQLTQASMFLWYGLFLLSVVPSAISNVYKQKVLKGNDVDVWYATWWSGNFQVIWGLLCFWINWVPLPDQPPPYSPGQTGQAISDTWQCFIGNVPHPGDESCASGTMPPIVWFGIYLCFNLTFNICLLWLTKQMSAMWAQIATTLCLDLTNIFSQFEFLMGKGAAVMSLSEWLATFLASVALWVYNVESESQRTASNKEDDGQLENLSLTVSTSLREGRSSLVESLSFRRSSGSMPADRRALADRGATF